MDAASDIFTTLLTILVVSFLVLGQIPGGMKLLVGLLAKLMKRFGLELTPGEVAEADEGAAQSIEAGRLLAQARSDFITLQERHSELLEQAQQASRAGPTPVLVQALEAMAAHHQSLWFGLQQSEQEQAASTLSPHRALSLGQAIQWEHARLSAADAMLTMRREATTAEMLADADAVAMALIAPLARFADTYQIALPRRRPITILAAPEQEAIWFGLLPDEYPVVFVPANFADDLYRWVSLPHELGHLLWRSVPDLADEVARATSLAVPPVPAATRANVSAAYAGWLEEVFCDFLATLQMGPVAVRSMLFALGRRVNPDEAVSAALVSDGRQLWFEEHPPVRLRVTLMLHLLHLMGFDGQRRRLTSEVERELGRSEHYGIPDLGQRWHAVPAERVEAQGRSLVEQLYHSQWRSLAGFPLPAIPGLALTPGRLAHVRQAAEQFSGGNHPSGDPVLLVAAALEARQKSPTSPRRLAMLVNHAIQGIDEPAQLADRTWSTAAEPSAPAAIKGDEVVEALLVDALLSHQGGLAQAIPATSCSAFRRGWGSR